MLRFFIFLITINLTLGEFESTGTYDMRISSSRAAVIRICIREFRLGTVPEGKCVIGNSVLMVQKHSDQNISIPFRSWPANISIVVTVQPSDVDESSADFTWTGEVLNDHSSDYKMIEDVHGIHLEHRIICNSNFYGPVCSVFCESNDNLSGHFTCSRSGDRVCMKGWSGPLCNQAICEKGCGKGTCVKPGVCKCPAGFYGTECNKCVPAKGCLNGGCDGDKPYTCKCQSNYFGPFCEKNRYYCQHHAPCLNGGTCMNGAVGNNHNASSEFTCVCPTGYRGIYCEKRSTDHVCPDRIVCLNGGSCTKSHQKFECSCPATHYGDRCEFEKVEASICSQKPCRNEVMCATRGNNTVCNCPSCFSGPRCEQMLRGCRPNEPFPLSTGSDLGFLLSVGLLVSVGFFSTACVMMIIYWKFKKLIHSPVSQNTINERRCGGRSSGPPVYQICVDESKLAPPPPYQECEKNRRYDEEDVLSDSG